MPQEAKRVALWAQKLRGYNALSVSHKEKELARLSELVFIFADRLPAYILVWIFERTQGRMASNAKIRVQTAQALVQSIRIVRSPASDCKSAVLKRDFPLSE